jgi:hypothetical protein
VNIRHVGHDLTLRLAMLMRGFVVNVASRSIGSLRPCGWFSTVGTHCYSGTNELHRPPVDGLANNPFPKPLLPAIFERQLDGQL